jgi:hypothetical protein
MWCVGTCENNFKIIEINFQFNKKEWNFDVEN